MAITFMTTMTMRMAAYRLTFPRLLSVFISQSTIVLGYLETRTREHNHLNGCITNDDSGYGDVIIKMSGLVYR